MEQRNINRVNSQVNKPAPRSYDAQDAPVTSNKANGDVENKRQKKNPIKILLVVLTIFVLIGLIVFALYFFFYKDDTKNQIQQDKYQAVLMSDGGGYIYGKLSVLNSEYYKMTEVYFIQATQQQADGENAQAAAQAELVTVKNSIHGPQDTVYINRDKVMLWQNLREDGAVMQTLNNNKKE